MLRTILRALSGTLATGALALVAIAWLVPAPASSQGRNLERQVKAAFLYKFTGYIEWPQHAFREANSPLVIGVVGDPVLARALDRVVEAHTAGARPIVVRRVDDLSSTGDLHMIFVSRSTPGALATLQSAPPRPLLIVSEVADGLSLGSMINFSLVEGRVRFEISLPAAERAGLTLSSRLLAVAQSVITEGR
jgi:hypothetical protein